MTKKIITVPVGAKVEIRRHSSSSYGAISYSRREIVYFKYESLNSAIETLQKLNEEYGTEYTDLAFDTIKDCGCYNDCHCEETMYVTGRRLENDKEYEFRLGREAYDKKENIKRDLAEFERLKEKLSK